jgi:hypothetical protein
MREDEGMKWIPPRSLAIREKWVREHRWIAGCYFGLIMVVFLTIVDHWASEYPVQPHRGRSGLTTCGGPLCHPGRAAIR